MIRTSFFVGHVQFFILQRKKIINSIQIIDTVIIYILCDLKYDIKETGKSHKVNMEDTLCYSCF